MKKNRTAKSKRGKSTKRQAAKIRIENKSLFLLSGVLMLLIGLTATHNAGPVTSLLSPLAKTAPIVQKDSTKLYTAEGLASSSSMLVKYKSNVTARAAATINAQNGAVTKRSIPGIGVQEIIVPDGKSIGNALRDYRGRSEVEYAEPNPVAQRFFAPNDTLYSKQWNLNKINAPVAWDATQGGYGPIAVVDTGISATHSDLAGEITSGYNFVNNTTDATDDNGHGTHVAGIIAGSSNNSAGIASIGFKGSLMPIKVLDNTGVGTYGGLASGIIYAADHGAKIINLSLGGSSTSQTLASAVSYAQQKGCLIVAAAGNNGNSAAVYPAGYSGVIAVSATTSSDTLASFSSYGSSVYVSAPGVGIISSYNNGGFATMSGTSMAAPSVSGLLGLALSHRPVDAQTLLSDLRQTSDKIGPYAYDASGRNQYFGYGRINAGKLLQLISSTAPPPTAPTDSVSNPEEPKPSASGGGQTAHGQEAAKFSVDFEGVVDSVDPSKGIVSVKINSISKNLKLADNNLLTIYVSPTSSLKANGKTITLAEIKTGNKLGGKALWENNILTAQSLTLQGRPDTEPATTGSQATTHGKNPKNN